MREILFRAWEKPDKSVNFEGKMLTDFYPDALAYWLKKPEDYELMQSTGLKDKNGVLIYEGDIVKAERSYWDEPRNLIVEWFGERYGLRNPKDNVDSEVMDKESCFNVSENEREIIGNIYENPELIKN